MEGHRRAQGDKGSGYLAPCGRRSAARALAVSVLVGGLS